MGCIAIIDDNTDQSGTVKDNIELELAKVKSELKVITSLPFKHPDEYSGFIESQNVRVLILDEKLNDQSIGDDGPVDYKGSDLISILRMQFKEMPIFAITLIPGDPELREKDSEFEEIISRIEFYDTPEKFVPKFLRASKSYLKDNLEELSLFNELTTLIASGNDDPALIKKLQALQIKLELPFSGFNDRKEWLDKYEELILQLEEINKFITTKIGQ
jgi:hypothetical protein